MDLTNLVDRMSKTKYLYVIERTVDMKRFYLFDIDETEDIGRVIWTPNIRRSLAFLVEEEVEEVKSEYSSLSSGVIVRIGKDELLKLVGVHI